MNVVFFDNDYRKMTTETVDFGKAVTIPVGAMFVCTWLTVEPETAWTVEPSDNPTKRKG